MMFNKHLGFLNRVLAVITLYQYFISLFFEANTIVKLTVLAHFQGYIYISLLIPSILDDYY